MPVKIIYRRDTELAEVFLIELGLLCVSSVSVFSVTTES
jgi:hypothetical protein